ncbi:MAG: hypothetical protein ACTSUE_23200 [Promethearchaeota archaeon]
MNQSHQKLDPSIRWINEVPFGIQDMMFKKGRWGKRDIRRIMAIARKYRDTPYTGSFKPDANVIAHTGIQPGNTHAVYLIDFDTSQPLDMEQIILIHKIIAEFGIHYKEMVYTSNGGLHFYIATDTKVEIHNKQKLPFKKNVFPDFIDGIDIRGKGGKGFRPPTKFKDCPFQCTSLLKHQATVLMDSQVLSNIIESFFEYEKKSRDTVSRSPRASSNLIKNVPVKRIQLSNNLSINVQMQNMINKMRGPLLLLVSPGAPDIESLPSRSGKAEFLYWKALFLESRANGIPDYVMFTLLDKYQPSFEVDKTVEQLRYLKYNKPFTNAKLQELFPWINIKK